ncbi:hypothetical protein D3C87_1260540 [compost metagenome]
MDWNASSLASCFSDSLTLLVMCSTLDALASKGLSALPVATVKVLPASSDSIFTSPRSAEAMGPAQASKFSTTTSERAEGLPAASRIAAAIGFVLATVFPMPSLMNTGENVTLPAATSSAVRVCS